MNKLYLILALCLSGLAHAESRKLPPIINNSTYSSGAAYSGQASSSQPMLEMLGQVESLQTEIQQLRGMVEQQSHEINNLKQRQQNIYTDLNMRLQQLETGAGITVDTTKAAVLAAPVIQRKPTAPAAVKYIEAVPVKKTRPKSEAEEKAAFDQAFISVKNSHYQQAIKLLEQFLVDYPDGVYADNAYFWLGSVYKVVNDIPAAQKNFQIVYTQFPKSEKAAMAMLKLADIYWEENDSTKALSLYTQLTTQYADSTAAQTAEKKLQNIGQ